jgi:hypothetical protein
MSAAATQGCDCGRCAHRLVLVPLDATGGPRGVQPVAEAAERPQHGSGQEADHLQREVHQRDAQQPQRAPPSRQEHRDDHREHHEHGQQDDRSHHGTDEQGTAVPAHASWWQHLRHSRPGARQPGPGSRGPRRGLD